MASNTSTKDQTAAGVPETKYTLLLNLHYDPKCVHPCEQSTNQEDAIVVSHTPEIEDEHVTAIEITLNTAAAAYLGALRSINPDRTITGVTVISDGGMDFMEHATSEIEPEIWDIYLNAAVSRTKWKNQEEEITAALGFTLGDGDENYFGEREDHQAMVTGQKPEKEEEDYEMI